MNLAVIGAGQLGSRHLQALALLEEKMNIYVVDPVDASLEISKQRFEQVDIYKNKTLFLKKTVLELPISLEFVVIATTSLQRLAVLKELLTQSTVKYLLLEKFLFPYINEYEEAKFILKDKQTVTYVNCARRMWTGYKEIKKKLSNSKKINLIIKGNNWNLASNSIHFFDLFHYLTNTEGSLSIDCSSLDQHVIQNKREGYIELTGTILATSENGNQLLLNSENTEGIDIAVVIESDDVIYEIDEQRQIIKFIQEDFDEFEFPVYYQSQLTHMVFQQLRTTGWCELTPFNISADHHLALLHAFNNFLGNREGIIT